MKVYWFLWLIPLTVGCVSVFLAQWRKGLILLKLATTGSVLVLILGCAFFGGLGASPVLFLGGLFMALAASMVGDFYLSSGDEGFIPGLAGFLFAHAGYLTAFLAIGSFSTPALFTAGTLLVLFLFFMLRPRIDTRIIFAAVFAYVSISVLVLGAAFGIESQSNTVRFLLAAGALLIAFSDLVIAWNKFIRPVVLDEFLILSTYYAAQICIGIGAWFVLGAPPA